EELLVHQLDSGGKELHVSAGAPNAVPGSLVPVALPGTTVPNGTPVRDTKIAGYDAKGMLCSSDELLLGGDHSERKILILDSGTPGDPLTTVIPSQAIMEAEITSNRPDEMGHLGVARELAAGLDRPMKRDFMPAFTGTADPPGRELVKVSIDDAGRPVAVAGVIGGEESAVTSESTDILLESANFDGPSIRQTSRALGLRTEASARFERALPPELALAGARRAASLIAELAGGK